MLRHGGRYTSVVVDRRHVEHGLAQRQDNRRNSQRVAGVDCWDFVCRPDSVWRYGQVKLVAESEIPFGVVSVTLLSANRQPAAGKRCEPESISG